MLATILLILSLLVVVVGIGVWAGASGLVKRRKEAYDNASDSYDKRHAAAEVEVAVFTRWVARISTAIGAVLTVIFLFSSTVVSNGIGEAKVYVNPDGTVAFTQETPGWQMKAPWQDYLDFDLFSQEILYAGQSGDAPTYAGGSISGAEVTVAVGGINGGSTQSQVDISVVYSIDADAVDDIYAKYRSQERFTKQVIEKTVLSTIRQIPSQFTATEFRGSARAEAAELILKALNEKFDRLGVTVDFVNIQDVRYPENVEAALADVEAANQAALKAEADLRAAEVAAEQRLVEATAQAEANKILSRSLTDDILYQRYIDALKESQTIYVVPDGSTPFVGVK